MRWNVNGEQAGWNGVENEPACLIGSCYRGLVFAFPLSLVLWAGLLALFYKVLS